LGPGADSAAAIARHSKDFEERAEFNYAVIDPGSGEVIGSKRRVGQMGQGGGNEQEGAE
jgi:hypothetical protein